MAYADYTYNSKNIVKRFAHRKRISGAFNFLPNHNFRLLDFGCGDAMFLNKLCEINKNSYIVGYEPILELIDDNKVKIFRDWENVKKEISNENLFDIVTCFDVLEHFAPHKQKELIEQICSVLKKNGTVIISVPVESGFFSLVKNLHRKRSNYKNLFTWKNILRAVFEKPVSHRQGDEYIYDHLGFYLKDLEKILYDYFKLVDKKYSPFAILGKQFNYQVFYKLEKID